MQESQWHPLFFSVMSLYCQAFVEVMYTSIQGSDLGEAFPEGLDFLELWGRSSLLLAKGTMTPGVLLWLRGTKGNMDTNAVDQCCRHWS